VPIRFEFHPLGQDTKVLLRRWEVGAPAHCRLCGSCYAGEPDGPRPSCVAIVPVDLAEADAPLYRAEDPS
jgi:hypothetical protein